MFKRYIDGYDKRLMKKKGFKYCKELGKFVLDGYGVYFTDLDKEEVDLNLKVLEQLGYDMVFGPIVEGNYLHNVGLYCKNYVDVLCNREMLKEDLDGLVKRIVLVSKLKDEVGDSSLYLEQFIIEEIKCVQDITINLDIDDFYKVVSNINSIFNTNNEVHSFTLKAMSRELSHYFYERVIIDLDKDVDREIISELVCEAECLAYDLRMARQHSFLTNPSTIEKCAKEMTGFVERVKNENTTSEIRGLLKGLEVSDDDYLDGTEYIVAILSRYAKYKTLEEYGKISKVKEKR